MLQFRPNNSPLRANLILSGMVFQSYGAVMRLCPAHLGDLMTWAQRRPEEDSLILLRRQTLQGVMCNRYLCRVESVVVWAHWALMKPEWVEEALIMYSRALRPRPAYHQLKETLVADMQTTQEILEIDLRRPEPQWYHLEYWWQHHWELFRR